MLKASQPAITHPRVAGRRRTTTLSVVVAEPEIEIPYSPRHQRGLLRLSLDLHDGPMQDLAAVGFTLERLRRDIESLTGDTSALLVQVDAVRDQLAMIELSLRRVVDTSGSQVPGSTLDALIDAEVDRFARLADAHVELRVEAGIEPNTDSQLIALHRVLREALTNVHKHACARRVAVSLWEEHDVIHLTVTDDGVGFDSNALGRAGAVGVNGMHERLRLLGGELRIDTQLGGPTTVAAAVHRWRPG